MVSNDIKMVVGVIVLVAIMSFLTGLLLADKFWSGKVKMIRDTQIEVVTDTLTHIIERQPVYITGKATVTYVVDTLYQKDTVYQTKAFVAKLDTAIAKDTVNVQYAFPQQTFSVVLRRAADSIRYETRTVYIQNTSVERPWLEYMGAAAIGLGAGYLIGR